MNKTIKKFVINQTLFYLGVSIIFSIQSYFKKGNEFSYTTILASLTIVIPAAIILIPLITLYFKNELELISKINKTFWKILAPLFWIFVIALEFVI